VNSKKKRKGEKGKAKKKIQNFDFSACPSQNVIKRDANGKNSKRSCCKCIFDQIKANLAKIQPENLQNVLSKEHVFCKKLQESMGKAPTHETRPDHNTGTLCP